MNRTVLEPLIQELIASKREGEYWDFKAKPHDNKADLLHDLLCLANSLHKGNRYLIFGVEDPAKGAAVVGLQPTTAGRKSQANYIDFVRNQKFAGGIRPEIELVQLTLDDKELDVLVIMDNPYKPYFVTEDYADQGRIVKAQHVYTRVGDTNTPLNKSADLLQVEKMWRQRLGLDLLPVERMKQLLGQPEEWFKDLGNKRYAYHKLYPDYRIKFSAPKPFWEPYSYFFSNKNSFLGTVAFKLNSTTLFELEYVYLDEMRLMLPAPDTKHVQLPNREIWYYYYLENGAAGRFLLFLTDGRYPLESRGSTAPFLLFKNSAEQQKFNNFLVANVSLLEGAAPGYWAQQAVRVMQEDGNSTVVDPLDIGRIAVLYTNWQQRRLLPVSSNDTTH